MDNRVPPNVALDALRTRLHTVSDILAPGLEVRDQSAAALLKAISRSVDLGGDPQKIWLLFVAVVGAMPRTDEFKKFRRTLQLAGHGHEYLGILEGAASPAAGNEFIARSFRLLRNRVVVDVDFSARFGHNTGIQRVVRETSKRWFRDHEIDLVAWTGDGELPRALSDDERDRVIAWTSDKKHHRPDPINRDDDKTELVVPWNCTIVLPEVADSRLYERLACAAEFSGNRVAMVGYDMIPVTSAEDVLPHETDRFVGYLSIVKQAHLVVAISASTASEFRGFNYAISPQGFTGPAVVHVALPVDVPSREYDNSLSPRMSSVPQVVSVGSHEPRKNQLAILAAAEALWNTGRKFDLLFIGGSAGSLSLDFDEEVARLKRRGRPITVLHHINEAILYNAYVESRFSIQVSKHEGYGLPVGESLAVGTPVITSAHGSLAEIATGGGCLMVDARDDEAIAATMARLLDDDVLLERLRSEAVARAPRSWDDYAGELWAAIVTSEASP